MRFGRWVVFTFLVQMVVVVLEKGAGIILCGLLRDRPDVKGAADMISNLPFLTTAVANLGLATALVYFVRRRRFPPAVVAGTTRRVALVWGGVVAVALVVLARTVGPLVKPQWNFDLIYVLPVCACVPLLLTASYANSLQLALDRVRDFNLVHLAQSATFLPLFFLLFFVLQGDAVVAMAFGRFGTALVVAALAVVMLRRVVRPEPRVDWTFVRDGVAYGWKANLNSILTIFSHRLDLYLVGILFVVTGLPADVAESVRFDQVGFYSLAVSLSQMVWHFPEATRDLFFSRVAGQTAEEARRFTPVVCRLCLAAAFAGGVLVAAVYDPLMTLVQGSAWDDLWRATVGACLWILLPGALTFTAAKVLQNDLAARGHLGLTLSANAVGFAVMLVLDWLWIPRHGARGAAWASTVGYGVGVVYTLAVYRLSGGARIADCLIPRPSDWHHVRDVWDAVRERLGRRR
jgi:O-antigen/teichoic acid export membrane protein